MREKLAAAILIMSTYENWELGLADIIAKVDGGWTDEKANKVLHMILVFGIMSTCGAEPGLTPNWTSEC